MTACVCRASRNIKDSENNKKKWWENTALVEIIAVREESPHDGNSGVQQRKRLDLLIDGANHQIQSLAGRQSSHFIFGGLERRKRSESNAIRV